MRMAMAMKERRMKDTMSNLFLRLFRVSVNLFFALFLAVFFCHIF